ncbi:MAG: hypothetical protein QGI86_05275 [Candidatus Poribacteria bacterium]|nr:hypothetical protein [Candidatus Poribacteria bacterium]MDP6748266.1 hypothetical protein [Candidatus Poribacteria bacterium]MDP6995275.1 hypothetical protein [Candidatus Poribacteria bacterium]
MLSGFSAQRLMPPLLPFHSKPTTAGKANVMWLRRPPTLPA